MTGADRDLSGLERIIKAFANRRRLGIVRHLKKNKEATVGDIADAIKLSFKATSKHLAILSAAGIVEREQRSLQMSSRVRSHRYFYSLIHRKSTSYLYSQIRANRRIVGLLHGVLWSALQKGMSRVPWCQVSKGVS